MKLPESIKKLIADYCGIDDTVIGNTSIAIFVRNRIADLHLPSADAYFDYLLANNSEFIRFADSLLVPETWFFRDTNPFLHLINFAKNFDQNKTILRILSLPCATGEEAYSISMSLINAGWSPNNFLINAVDLSQNFLNFARNGIYTSRSFRSQDTFDRSQFFDEIDDKHFSVKEIFRKPIHFLHGNILNPFLFSEEPPFHIIFSRNILIYLTISAQKKSLINLNRLLAENGNLFLGHADHISLLTDKFKPTGPPSAFAFEKSLPKSSIPPAARLSPEAHRAQGESTQSVGRELTERRRDSSSIQPSSSRLLETIKEFVNKGLFDQAQEYATSYVDLYGPSASIFFLMGQIFSAQGNLDSAEDAYKKAIYLDHSHLEALAQSELLYLKKGDKAQAKILHDRLIRLKNNK